MNKRSKLHFVDIKIVIELCLLLPAFSVSADVQNSTSNKAVDWKLYSQAMAKWLWVDVYQASLFVDANRNSVETSSFLDEGTPLKLQLCYQTSLKAEQIIEAAENTLPESLNQGVRQQIDLMHTKYQAVGEGDCYVLEAQGQGKTTLKLNNKLVFTTDTQGFKSAYFGIWIGSNPLSESLKNELLEVP